MATSIFESSEDLIIQYYNGSTWANATLLDKRSPLLRMVNDSFVLEDGMASKIWADSGGIYIKFGITFFVNNSTDHTNAVTFINLFYSRGTYASAGNDYFKILIQGTGTTYNCYPLKLDSNLNEGFGQIDVGFVTKDKTTSI